jgi:hypothetical protein
MGSIRKHARSKAIEVINRIINLVRCAFVSLGGEATARHPTLEWEEGLTLRGQHKGT